METTPETKHPIEAGRCPMCGEFGIIYGRQSQDDDSRIQEWSHRCEKGGKQIYGRELYQQKFTGHVVELGNGAEEYFDVDSEETEPRDKFVVVLMFVPDNCEGTESVQVDLFNSFEDAKTYAKEGYVLGNDSGDLEAYQRCSATVKADEEEQQEFADSGVLTLYSTFIR